MGQPIVHFDIIGRDPEMLRRFYGELFDWSFTMNARSVMEQVVGHYGFVESTMSGEGMGIPGGVGGGPDFEPRANVYVGVPDVAAALDSVEALGGSRILGPCEDPHTGLVVGLFTDPEGQVVGLANAT